MVKTDINKQQVLYPSIISQGVDNNDAINPETKIAIVPTVTTATTDPSHDSLLYEHYDSLLPIDCITKLLTETQKQKVSVKQIEQLFREKKDHILVPLLKRYLTHTNPQYVAFSLYYLGRIYCEYTSEFYNLQEGVRYIELASIKYNHSHATCMLAAWAVKMSERVSLYEKAARHGSKYATTWLGRYYFKQGDERRGMDLLHSMATLNYIDAINELGTIYDRKKMYRESFGMWLKSHDLGNIIGTKMCGLAYKDNNGVRKDLEKARELLTIYWKATQDHSLLDLLD